MDKNEPTKNVFLSSVSLKNEQQNEKVEPTKKAVEVLGKKPMQKPYDPFKMNKQIRNTDGLNNVEINGISLNGKDLIAKIQSQNNLQQNKVNNSTQTQSSFIKSDNSKRMTTYSTSNVIANRSVNKTNFNNRANSNSKTMHSQNHSENKTKQLNTFEKIDNQLKNQKNMPQKRVRNVVEAKIEGEETKVNFQNKSKNSLKVIFLGGVGEIGKNMMALEYGRDIIVIDCGSTFPYGELMPGIDLVVPDITYLTQNKERVRGIVVTHGHEDHIGAIPYVLNELDVPVYGSKLTIGLIENKLREFPKIKPHLNSIKTRDTVYLGCFSVEFIAVNHSIAGAMAMAITCPAGVMFHTGDFKIDFTPTDGVVTDLGRIAELGKQGVMLLTCESTNIEKPGHSMSESQVGKTLNDLFDRFKDERIFIATFASNVYRLGQILNLAEKYNRKVTFTGRSMKNVSETAYKIGELKFNPKIFIDLEDINKYQDNEVLVLTTGSQGEPMSALTRMATNEFPGIKLNEHDAVIFSSSPIPGNEKAINIVINQLYRLGCKVIYNSLEAVHASGHAYQEEIKLIHELVKPKFFIPVHGEYRHLKLHQDLAQTMGMDKRNSYLASIGDVIEVNSRSMKLVGKVPSGDKLVDGLGLGDSDSTVLSDRKQLSEDGLAVVVLGINPITKQISSGPDIISRGLIYSNEMDNLVREAKEVVVNTVKEIPLSEFDYNLVKSNVKRAMRNFFFKKTKRRPMVLTIVIEN